MMNEKSLREPLKKYHGGQMSEEQSWWRNREG